MTNSDLCKTEAIIEKVFELTSDEYLQHFIDEPIEKAQRNFEFDDKAFVTYRTFFQVTGNFVRHIYKDGLRPGQILSDSQARAEALAIIEEGYQNVHAKGFDAAFLDASDPNQTGLGPVLAHLKEIITARARLKRITWVYSSCIDPSDWPTKCLIAEILLERWGRLFPPSLLAYTPAQLADALPYLFDALRRTKHIAGKVMRGDMPLYELSEMP